MRADRFEERTATKVATANTSVPAAVASDATVDRSAMATIYLPGAGRTHRVGMEPPAAA
jgi:hypothetical protein